MNTMEAWRRAPAARPQLIIPVVAWAAALAVAGCLAAQRSLLQGAGAGAKGGAKKGPFGGAWRARRWGWSWGSLVTGASPA